MKDDVFDKYRNAGSLAARILREGAHAIRVGASYLDLVESIEAQEPAMNELVGQS